MKFYFGIILGLFSLVNLLSSADTDWQQDFKAQRPDQRPHLEARYTSAQRDGFLIEAERYTIQIDLSNQNRHAISSIKVQNKDILQQGHIQIVNNFICQ